MEKLNKSIKLSDLTEQDLVDAQLHATITTKTGKVHRGVYLGETTDPIKSSQPSNRIYIKLHTYAGTNPTHFNYYYLPKDTIAVKENGRLDIEFSL